MVSARAKMVSARAKMVSARAKMVSARAKTVSERGEDGERTGRRRKVYLIKARRAAETSEEL
jgi:hypothetical protein